MRERREFPPESDWLGLPAPEVSPSFVDDVLRRLRAEGLVGDSPAVDQPMPVDLLAAWTPPPASADFVERTLSRWREEASGSWQRFLRQHAVPPPSEGFVERTLAALRTGVDAPLRGRVLQWPRQHRAVVTAAAALLVVALTVLLVAPREPRSRRLPIAQWSRLQSPSIEPLASGLAAATVVGLDMPVGDPAFALDAVAREGR